MNATLLSEYGIDPQKGLERCMGDVKLYETVLGMFLSDGAFNRAQQSFEARDYSELFSDLHELKGSSGNLELTSLYKAVSPLVELLREGGDDKAIAEAFERVSAEYACARLGIERALEAV